MEEHDYVPTEAKTSPEQEFLRMVATCIINEGHKDIGAMGFFMMIDGELPYVSFFGDWRKTAAGVRAMADQLNHFSRLVDKKEEAGNAPTRGESLMHPQPHRNQVGSVDSIEEDPPIAT